MGAIQNSINYALGTAAIASGLTNKKQAEKAQDKLDDKTKELVNKEVQLAKTTEEKNEAIKQQAKDAKALSEYKDEQNMKYGLNAYTASNDLSTAKETNIDNIGDNSVSINNNSVNSSIGSSMVDYLKYQQKVNPYTFEQFMGSHALKMRDSRIAAKREVMERNRLAMIRARAKNGGNE